jgi:ABC-type glycerol-3-phosphate transport system substrate-binding protein
MTPAQAQEEVTTISLTVPRFMEDVFSDEIIAQFEAENTDIDVHIVNSSGFGIPFTGDESVEDYLDSVEEYVESADVILIDSETMLPEATRAGYFLDLYPLVNTDTTINRDDFYPSVWQSFQWDGGMWAIPVTVDAVMIFYDEEAFDDAGLAYPDEAWTMYDYEFAVRTLTRFNDDGSTEMPGWINSGGEFGTLFLASIGDTVFDQFVLPNEPRYDNPDLEETLSILAGMYDDGLMDIPSDDDFDFEDVPLQLGRVAFNISNFSMGNSNQKTPALLPGGRAGLVLNAYAISSGTQYPEEAYRLLKFLSYSPEVADAFFAGEPARISVEEVEQDFGGLAQQFLNRTSAETDELIQRGIQNGLGPNQARFSKYLEDGVTRMVTMRVNAREALDETELEVVDRLQFADNRHDSVDFIVELPPPPIELAPGEIRIYFGVTAFITPLPNIEQWESLAQDFVFNDSQVGDVVLDVALPGETVEELTEEYDCFYMDTNVVQSVDLNLLRSIDPLLGSDPTFDANDIVGNALGQVQRNNQTWAMPLMIQPATMRYNSNLFIQAGAVPPVGGWTVDQFEDSMRLLKSYMPEGQPPYQPHEFGNSYLLILIAAYGGLPFDYRTDPMTVNFSDPNTVEAIRSVLDLGKDGYIDYRPLASMSGFSFSFRDDNEMPLYSEVLDALSVNGGFGGFGGFLDEESGGSDHRNTMTSFPRGSQYAAVSYDVGAAYISASSQYTEACYRFISYIAQSPDLFDVMPARRPHISSTEVVATQGQDTVDFYNSLDELMQEPNTISIPAFQLNMEGIKKIFSTFWLGRAFDRYVLEDADLEKELEDAEIFTLAYLDCEAAIPPFDPTVDEPQTYFTQFAQCAFRIDPTVLTFFSDD